MHTLSLVEQDTTPVVTLSEAKKHLRIDTDYDDTYIASLVEVVTSQVEAETNCDLRTTTWEMKGSFPHPRWVFGFASPYHHHDFTDGWLRGFRHKMILPRAPLQSVTSVTYYDINNQLQTWDSSNYFVMKSQKCLGWLQAALFYPPTFDAFRPDAVTVTFVSGYATAPATAKHLVLLGVGTLYENRESEVETPLSMLNLGYERLLDQIRIEAAL